MIKLLPVPCADRQKNINIFCNNLPEMYKIKN